MNDPNAGRPPVPCPVCGKAMRDNGSPHPGWCSMECFRKEHPLTTVTDESARRLDDLLRKHGLHHGDAVLAEVAAERARQGIDIEKHRPSDWMEFIEEQLVRADDARQARTPDDYRRCLVELAALAVAAVESWDRKQGAKQG